MYGNTDRHAFGYDINTHTHYKTTCDTIYPGACTYSITRFLNLTAFSDQISTSRFVSRNLFHVLEARLKTLFLSVCSAERYMEDIDFSKRSFWHYDGQMF